MCLCVAEAAVCDGVLRLAAVHVHRSAAEDSERDPDPQRRESPSLPVFASHRANQLAARVNPSLFVWFADVQQGARQTGRLPPTGGADDQAETGGTMKSGPSPDPKTNRF